METRPIEFERTPVRDSHREIPFTERLSDLSKNLLQSGVLLWREVTSPARPHSRPAGTAHQPMTHGDRAPHPDPVPSGTTSLRVDPKIRAFGKARLDIASRVRSHEDWEALWVEPRHGFPFSWGTSWRHCMEYQVDEFAAEVGFFVDILGFSVTAIGPEYAMFSSPDQAFHFSVVPAPPEGPATPPEAVRMQFQVADLGAATRTLKRRGVSFEQEPAPLVGMTGLSRGYFRTPNGICIDLLGETDPPIPQPSPSSRGEARLTGTGAAAASLILEETEPEQEMDDESQGQEAQPVSDTLTREDPGGEFDDKVQEDWLDLEYTDEV